MSSGSIRLSVTRCTSRTNAPLGDDPILGDRVAPSPGVTSVYTEWKGTTIRILIFSAVVPGNASDHTVSFFEGQPVTDVYRDRGQTRPIFRFEFFRQNYLVNTYFRLIGKGSLTGESVGKDIVEFSSLCSSTASLGYTSRTTDYCSLPRWTAGYRVGPTSAADSSSTVSPPGLSDCE